MIRRTNILADIDWLTVAIFIIIVIFGWMNIYAVSYDINTDKGFNFSDRYGMQLIWIMISVLLLFIIFIIDVRFYTFFAYFFFGLSIFFLVIVLFVGREVNYARSWIYFGRFSFQPSEFAKIGTCLAIARYLSSYNIKAIKFKSITITLSFIIVPFALIALQPDFGSAIVFAALILILYREGFPGWILVVGIFLSVLFFTTLKYSQTFNLLALISISIIYYLIISKKVKYSVVALSIFGSFFLIIFFLKKHIFPELTIYFSLLITLGLTSLLTVIIAIIKKIPNVAVLLLILFGLIAFTYSVDSIFQKLPDHQQRRVNILIGEESDPFGYEYNINQSKIAIGSGGFAGKGFLRGTQTKFKFVPEQDTDFIFCTVGEEWGFLGTSGLVLLYTSLLIRLIYLAERQRQKFGRIYGYGVISILLFHVVINIGMTIGLLPVIGIPLPFISYGGSSFISFTILLFIFIRLDASRKLLLY